jgi:hypothetical protein
MGTARVDEPPPSAEAVRVERELGERGWEVSSHLLWVAVARRGGEVEQAEGHSREEALARLVEALRLDEGARLP